MGWAIWRSICTGHLKRNIGNKIKGLRLRALNIHGVILVLFNRHKLTDPPAEPERGINNARRLSLCRYAFLCLTAHGSGMERAKATAGCECESEAQHLILGYACESPFFALGDLALE